MTGKVKNFNDGRGFGFVTPDDGSPDAFVHQSAILMRGRRTLMMGQKVHFQVISTDKGPRAINVRPHEAAI